MAIRFHLDEHIDPAVAMGLRQRGVDVSTSQEAGLLGADDRVQLNHVADHVRVLVTQDADFLRMHAEGVAHAGIVFCQSGLLNTGSLLRGLLLIHGVLNEEDMTGRIEFLL